MNEIELAGRIEAVSKFVLHLAAELEMAGLIDGPRFSRRLRGSPRMPDQVPYIQRARECLTVMADTLDAARADRGEFPIPADRR